MEFTEQQTTIQSIQNNYEVFCDEVKKHMTKDNVVNDLDSILNTMNFNITQYKIDDEYLIKVKLSNKSVYFIINYRPEYPITGIKSIFNKIKIAPTIKENSTYSTNNEDEEDGYIGEELNVDFEAYYDNIPIKDILDVVFLTPTALMYHNNDIINNMVKQEKVKFEIHYPTVNPIIQRKSISDIVQKIIINTPDSEIKTIYTTIERTCHNFYSINIIGFVEQINPEEIEEKLESDDNDTWVVNLSFDKNINTVYLNSYTDKVEKQYIPENFFYVNKHDEKFKTNHLPLIKSKITKTECELIPLINKVFTTNPFIEVPFFNVY